MRVAYDIGILLHNPTGVTRYAVELGHALEKLGIELRRFAVSLRARHMEASVTHWRFPARLMQLSWRWLQRPAIQRLVGEVDLVHGTNFVLPPTGGSKGIVSIHDLSFRPEHGYVDSRRLSVMTSWSVARAAGIIVPSRAIATEVSARYGIPDNRLFVTPEGVTEAFFAATPLEEEELRNLGIARPFAMALGTIQPRKNLSRLLAAWARASDALRGWTLVLVGPAGWGPDLPDVPGVVRTGWVEDGMLPGLLAAAEFFCYPSLYEGFGLPPLEAMAAGTPVLAGNYSAATELLGDWALIVNRYDVDAIAEGLSSLANDGDLRHNLATAGRAHSRSFTWERAARETARVYETVLDG
jgi:glycosyltransferase involved in cell wall biosynthesis